MTLARPKYESFAQYSNFWYWYLSLLIIKNISKISLHLIIISNRPNHEKFSSICAHKDFCFIKPAMHSKISVFRQFFNILRRLKRIIFNFIELKEIFSANWNYMRLSWTYRKWWCSDNGEVANSEPSTSRDV